MHASLAQNSEKQTAKIHSPASSLSLAGSRPCTFYTKHTQNAKNQLSLLVDPLHQFTRPFTRDTVHYGWVGGLSASLEPLR